MLPVEGKYEILERLGEGGMGSVYKVRHRYLDEVRVIKVVRPQFASNENFRARFLGEARVANKLRHPNIAQLYDFSIAEDGTAFTVMEFISGKTLEEILRSTGPPSLGLALEVAQQTLSAIGYLHAKGFIHRDISPDNLMLSEHLDGSPQIKLIDLGVAKSLDIATELTQTGFFIGKLRYASPESFGAEGAATNDLRGDLYSFGIVLYELLTGIYPIIGKDAASIFAGHLLRLPISFTESDPQGRVPLGVRAAILKALAKNPSERYASANDFAVDLAGFQFDIPAAELTLLLERPAIEPDIQPEIPESKNLETRLEVSTTVLEKVDSITSESGLDLNLMAVPERVYRSDHGPGSYSPNETNSTLVASSISAVTVPQRIRRFTIHELIACGRSGSLYKAYDPVRGGLFGLKVIPITDETAHERLLRGGRIWLSLTHPNLLKVLEIHPAEGGEPAVIVTELVDGVDLGTLIGRHSLTLEVKLEIALQISEALAYLHDQGLIHREVKPSNVLVSRGPHALLLDSGIARPSNPDLENLTRTGMIIGDLHYMAPEQLIGKAEVRSDIFSLGALIYELLVGEQPRLDQRADLFDRLHKDPSLSQRLTEVVKKCLAENPRERYASAYELSNSLRGFMANATPRARVQHQVVALHGIRTYAGWQRAFAEVADEAFWRCRSDRWNFGYFSSVKFFQPWSRSAKVEWFRRTYREEFSLGVDSGAEVPSIVAHSFGAYILGNSLLRYPYLRFNKVIICGSILPTDFPWSVLLDSGQVQSVRNEYGARDFWTGLVEHFIPGTGASGRIGFSQGHPRLEQERFEFSHSEYFERSHMEGRWIPFLSRAETFVAPRGRPEQVNKG